MAGFFLQFGSKSARLSTCRTNSINSVYTFQLCSRPVDGHRQRHRAGPRGSRRRSSVGVPSVAPIPTHSRRGGGALADSQFPRGQVPSPWRAATEPSKDLGLIPDFGSSLALLPKRQTSQPVPAALPPPGTLEAALVTHPLDLFKAPSCPPPCPSWHAPSHAWRRCQR